MGDENSKNPNTKGKKAYEDFIIKQLDQSDLTTETFPRKENESKVADTVDDLPKDFAKLDDVTLGSNANPEIEHNSEAKIYSKSHEFDPETKVQGIDSGRTPKFGKTDDTAKGEQ